MFKEWLYADRKIVKFARLRQEAQIPTKREEDAGFDVYACFDGDFIEIKPHETVIVPSCIASAFSPEYVAVLKERGSTGTKGIKISAGVIDSGYRGEWMVPITNANGKTVVIMKSDKKHLYKRLFNEENSIIYPYEKAIAQALFLPVPKMIVQEITYKELQDIDSERGAGKLGSSGK